MKEALDVGDVRVFCSLSEAALHRLGLTMVLKVRRSCSGGVMLSVKDWRVG